MLPFPPPHLTPPALFVQFIQITALNKRDKTPFDLASFEDIRMEAHAVAVLRVWDALCSPQQPGTAAPIWGRGSACFGGSSGAGSVDVQEMEQCFCGLCRRCP